MAEHLLRVCLEAWRNNLGEPYDLVAQLTLKKAGEDFWKPLRMVSVANQPPQLCHQWQPWDICQNVSFLYVLTEKEGKKEASGEELAPKESLGYSHLGQNYSN